MAASLLGLGLLLGGTAARAQDLPALPPLPEAAAAPAPLPPVPAPEAVPLPPPHKAKTLHFSRDPLPATPPAPPPSVSAASPRSQPRLPQRVAVQDLTPQRARQIRKEQQSEESVQYLVPTEPPGLARIVLSVQSDAALMERMRQEKRSQGTIERIVFPEEVVLSKVAYAGRRWEPLKELAEPSFVTYHRLTFEQKNAERYGWDLGVIHPVLSALVFYKDVVTLPYQLGKRPFQQIDSSAGYCLPGDPVPLMIYPPEWSLSGLALETAVVVPLFFAFP
jgi:hypothetical protein